MLTRSSEMDANFKRKVLILLFWSLLFLNSISFCNSSSGIAVKFLKTPSSISNRNSAQFVFEVMLDSNNCSRCTTICKLDSELPSACHNGRVSYTRLQDGNHTVEVCTNASRAVGCLAYDWVVDTVPPTAYLTAATTFTNALQVPVNISFSEPCERGGGFKCSEKHCNLLVYGDGQVVPNTFEVIQSNHQYSVTVSLSTSVQFGRAFVTLDKSFCTDTAGNKFARTHNSSLLIHFDRRSVFGDLRTHIPEKLVEINKETRTVLATNKTKNLRIYLYFSEPVLNSSSQVLTSLDIDQGSLFTINGNDFGNRRFGFQVKEIPQMAVVTVKLDSRLIISRQGTPVSPVGPVTFLYDTQRPAVWLSTTSANRTRDKIIQILIKFMKPVFGFNSSHINFSGGHLKSFSELSWSMYELEVQANDGIISINIAENVTKDISGNGNLASNTLQVWHYSVPSISMALSSITTATFAFTSLAAGFLTVSTASLQSLGAFTTPSPILISYPARNLFRIASHIQVFALSRWLSVTLPVEYYEFARGLQWSIPYFDLPWETKNDQALIQGSNSPYNAHPYVSTNLFKEASKHGEQSLIKDSRLFGLPLSATEYRTIFQDQNIVPEAQDIFDPQNSLGWREMKRSMFWLAVIYGSLEMLHALFLVILKIRKKSSSRYKSYGALMIPRFEIFLLLLALPCVCKASAALLKGGATSGVVVGALLLALLFLLLLGLFLFLSLGITLGKLLQYKEVHNVDEKFHWYQELIRVTLGPGKRGQWTWKNHPDSKYIFMLGPLFEDLRGPPKYMLSQITGGTSNKRGSNRIIDSDDETEDAEAPFIQKLFGILRIYYTLLEVVKRVSLGIVAGAYSKNRSSRTPTIILLCITSFQLFFMVLKKPFIKKRVQLVEIISVACEVCLFASCMVLLEKEFTVKGERKIGIFMLSAFLLAFLVQMSNEWYSLVLQTKHLDQADNFLTGLKTASIGILLFFVPSSLIKKLDDRFPLNNSRNGETGNTSSLSDRSSGERPWIRQLRELAKSSFSKEASSASNDPSTSQSRGFWNMKRSGSPSMSSSSDFKSKPKGLYKDLEAIFASK